MTQIPFVSFNNKGGQSKTRSEAALEVLEVLKFRAPLKNRKMFIRSFSK